MISGVNSFNAYQNISQPRERSELNQAEEIQKVQLQAMKASEQLAEQTLELSASEQNLQARKSLDIFA
ncbi:hypothetical protein [Campylobacter suis]|uniref:Flagellin n=1 Tax=Campylobacter suis TaxID=2790657 RepID=A0ABN7K2D5_9BACT|nr:hypothetical protein [Campylobacter suis]CAD7286697.1 hypothetical protein LMG8286_00492 [Campylobacter suis]